MRSSPRAAAALALILCCALPTVAAAAPHERVVVPGQYIVLYERSVADAPAATDRREQRDGFRSRLRYGKAVKGFAARLSRAQVDRLKADPAVALVAPDRRVRATDALAAGDAVPSGVRRMQAGTASTVRGAASVNVAVIDTGIDLDHPDLAATAGKNCVTPGAAPEDDNGHGTHVAGTVAAMNNGAGVVGVAPGTRVFAAKVLDAGGSGTASQVICGIDWVTSTRTDADPANDIAVANMSLGGPGAPLASCATTTDPEHRAICASTAAGVTYVVAAGNDGWDYDYAPQPDTPAVYPQVLTVTAMGDSDGLTGAGGGAPTCRTGEADDRYASFSNFATGSTAQAHTIAGPGVCIRSTWPGGGHDTISGTSMASPHLAGAVALCLAEAGVAGPCAGLTPAEIITKMRSDAAALNGANTWFGFTGDPLRPLSGRYYGHLAFAGTGEPQRSTFTSTTAAPSQVTVAAGTLTGGSAASLAADDSAFLQVASTTSSPRRTDWTGTFTSVPSAISGLKVTYKGSNSRKCAQVVEIWRVADARWVALDSRNVGSTQTSITATPSGASTAYRTASGEVGVRVRCSTTSGAFTASGNLLRLSFTVAS